MAIGNSSQHDGMMSEINVTPLVDVMLVLLVVFIITAPLLSPQSLKINLPKTAAVASDNKPQPDRLLIDAQGKISLNEKTLGDAELGERLRAQVGSNPVFQLQIQADKAVPYGRVAEMMAIAQRAGVSKLAFVTLVGK